MGGIMLVNYGMVQVWGALLEGKTRMITTAESNNDATVTGMVTDELDILNVRPRVPKRWTST